VAHAQYSNYRATSMGVLFVSDTVRVSLSSSEVGVCLAREVWPSTSGFRTLALGKSDVSTSRFLLDKRMACQEVISVTAGYQLVLRDL
jgi:hypothetical protein